MIRTILISTLLLLSYAIQAQQLPNMGHYIYNPYLLNPARTGAMGDEGSLFIHFKRQWTSMPYSPTTGILSVELPVQGTNMGVGGMLYSDRSHLITRTGGMGSYAYHIPLEKKFRHSFSAGLSVGAINQRFDFALANIDNRFDPQVLDESAFGTTFDFSMGLLYRWRDLEVGLSALQAFNSQTRFLGEEAGDLRFVNTRHFIVSARYDFHFGEGDKLLFRPILMTRLVDGVTPQIEVNAQFAWKKTFWLALGYRSSNTLSSTSAVLASFGVRIKDRIFFGYSAESGLDAQINSNFGLQHEFSLAYTFGENEKLTALEKEMNRMQKREGSLLEEVARNRVDIDSIQRGQGQARREQERLLERQERVIRSLEDELEMTREDLRKMRTDIEDQPMKYKKLGTVQFSVGSSTLSANAKAKLDALSAIFQQSANTTLYLYGNGSSEGSAELNLRLSTERCTSVRKYLIGKGITPERIIIVPMGEVNPSSGKEGVDENDRRVDLMISQE